MAWLAYTIVVSLRRIAECAQRLHSDQNILFQSTASPKVTCYKIRMRKDSSINTYTDNTIHNQNYY